MTGFALKGLAARKLRSLLTMVAIVLGVAMVSGTYVLTDTIEKAFDEIFTSSYENTDVVVTGIERVEWSDSGRSTVPESLLAKVRALPEVEAAAGTLLDLSGDADQIPLLDKEGVPIQNGNPTFGFGVEPDAERFNPFELVEGRWAGRDGEVVIDVETASNYGFRVGDEIGVAPEGPTERFRIVGLSKFGDVSTIGGATIALFTVDEAQRLNRKDGFDAIAVAAKDGVSDDALIAAIGQVAPASVDIRTGAEQAETDGEGVGEFVSFIRYFLLAFGLIALFVGAFVIFNSLSITIAQRTRELATLRTLGASRRQVLRSVIVEGAALGLIGSLIGLVCGLLLANGLAALFAALDLQLPQSDTVLQTRTFVVPLLLGVGITLFASIVPAIRATRIAPIAAVREGADLSSPRMSRRVTAAAIAVASIAGAAVAYGVLGDDVSTGQRILLMTLGTLGLFVGVAMLAPRLVRPLAALVGQPSARVGGVAGRLARQNAVRNPSRTAATAAALMIGLTLVTFVSVLAAGLLDSGKRAVIDQTSADYVVTSRSGWESLPVDAGRAVAQTGGVEIASSVRGDNAMYQDGSTVGVSGVDPATIADVYRFDWKAGSIAGLDRRGALVHESLADDKVLRIGSAVVLETPSGKTVRVLVRGIFSTPEIDSLLAPVVITQARFDASFERPSDSFTLVKAESRDTLEAALEPFPAAKVDTPSQFADTRHNDLSTILNLVYVLLALAVIVSLFGMVNTLVLAVFERTREIGMLRAVGMTRRQVRRMVSHEGVITALIGAGIGLPLGVALAALAIQPMEKYGVGFTLPVGTLAVFAIVASVAGFFAAMFPARRASRLNVLNALQYE